MTRAYSRADDNGGRCERCDDPSTVHQAQTLHSVMLGGGLGLGTMWLCARCAKERVAESPNAKTEIVVMPSVAVDQDGRAVQPAAYQSSSPSSAVVVDRGLVAIGTPSPSSAMVRRDPVCSACGSWPHDVTCRWRGNGLAWVGPWVVCGECGYPLPFDGGVSYLAYSTGHREGCTRATVATRPPDRDGTKEGDET